MNAKIEKFMRLYGEQIQLQLIQSLSEIRKNLDADSLIMVRQILFEAVKQIDTWIQNERIIVVDDNGKIVDILAGKDEEDTKVH